MKLNILIAMEESQRTVIECNRLTNKDIGLDEDLEINAYSCDIMPCSGGRPDLHIQQDVVPLLNGDCSFKTCDGKEHRIEGHWDLIIGHPPCTYFSIASAPDLIRHGVLNKERYEKGLKMKELFLSVLNAKCEHICVENPTHLKIWELPKHNQVIQPWMFSEFGRQCKYKKRTCLWLKNLPHLEPEFTTPPSDVSPWCNNSTKGISNHAPACTAIDRSKTFHGIAHNFALQFVKHISQLKKENTNK